MHLLHGIQCLHDRAGAQIESAFVERPTDPSRGEDTKRGWKYSRGEDTKRRGEYRKGCQRRNTSENARGGAMRSLRVLEVGKKSVEKGGREEKALVQLCFASRGKREKCDRM